MRSFPLFLLALAAACAAPEVNPFVGAWATADRQEIAFRDDTVIINPPGAGPTAMGTAECAGQFRFLYARKSRDALVGLAPTQPDLTRKLGQLLVQPEYQVAELACGGGASTYVLLGERELVAIYRDRDVAGLERLSRL